MSSQILSLNLPLDNILIIILMSTTLKHFVSVRTKKYFHMYLSLCVPVHGILLYVSVYEFMFNITSKFWFCIHYFFTERYHNHARNKVGGLDLLDMPLIFKNK